MMDRPMLEHLRQEMVGFRLRSATATEPSAPETAAPDPAAATVEVALEVPDRSWPALALALESVNSKGKRSAAAASGQGGFTSEQRTDLIYLLTAMSQVASSRAVRIAAAKNNANQPQTQCVASKLKARRRHCALLTGHSEQRSVRAALHPPN